VVLSIFTCAVFPRVARKNRTPTIGTYHAAAGNKRGVEMRNNATALLLLLFVVRFSSQSEKRTTGAKYHAAAGKAAFELATA